MYIKQEVDEPHSPPPSMHTGGIYTSSSGCASSDDNPSPPYHHHPNHPHHVFFPTHHHPHYVQHHHSPGSSPPTLMLVHPGYQPLAHPHPNQPNMESVMTAPSSPRVKRLRANDRERRRVHLINCAMEELKEVN